ncbi:lipid IV(A) 4-amino-4-deoxy-L-arabinosyltransferase [Pseudomonas sp. S75]|uniref:lipid IV(A) 4-amino-4-deoxy-L-arabinosyltransferase n=1 Tax=unclassified Pseudomonas TaxID=196821 RepID=UPI001906A9D3|nr:MULTISPECIES: lipid IV(A) 4-amino-4-deoxy-L-arabinosyltransferase [unclassified Pseudomonas]MBJ9975035.1 lipid IV(A) 4-amino-4-deoxy-L-arabinosyltransferase [Pseudomonas sp. S30]MBK0152872.1 lipid IV(A) 4-amino-4-deoxy-L-arabinosyltransferase [Pseudomonas sp. S75]
MSRAQCGALLGAIFLLFYVVPLGFHGLWIPDETRYAQIGQAMLRDGDWIAPHFLGMRYFEKPVAGYWMIAAGQALFGENLLGVRIASLVATALSTLLVYWLAQSLWRNRRTSLLAATFYASFGLIAGQSGYSNLDPQFTWWVNLSIAATWWALNAHGRGQRLALWTVTGLACGMGFLTKGFLAWLLPVLVVVPYALWHKCWRPLLSYGPLAVVVALLVSAPWALAVHGREPDYWNFFFWHEHIRRFAAEDAQHVRPWWFYLPLLLAATLPWAGLLPASLKQAWQHRATAQMAFLLLWMVLPFVFFSISRGKLPTYIMPCLMPLALIMAHAIDRRLDERRSAALRLNGAINLCIAVIAGVVLAYLQWQRPLYVDQPLLLMLAALVVAIWGAAGLTQVLQPLRCWYAPLLGLWTLIAILPAAMPHHVVYNKTPDRFVDEHLAELAGVRHLVSNDLGAASALAWRLKTSEVTLYGTRGELKYGLSYVEHSHRSVVPEAFDDWLQAQRQSGSVGILLRSKDDSPLTLPPVLAKAKRYSAGRLTLLILEQSR